MLTTSPPSTATPADAASIAALFASSWTSPFTALQLGYVDPSSLSALIAQRIAQQIAKPTTRFIVARDLDTQDIVSVAQWSLPSDDTDTATTETPAEREERQKFEDELYRVRLPESCNKDLKLAFITGLRETRENIIMGRKHYLLDNLATHPAYRGKGLASTLVEWGTARADEDGVLTYLDTAADNPAIRMYERLGFEERGRSVIERLGGLVREGDLQRYGEDRGHTHVAFVREPVGK